MGRCSVAAKAGADVLNKFYSSSWNKALWLDIESHMTFLANHSALFSHAMQKFVYGIGSKATEYKNSN